MVHTTIDDSIKQSVSLFFSLPLCVCGLHTMHGKRRTEQKEPDDPFTIQADNLDVDEFDDELNDETFGDPVADDVDDWEAAQDLYNGKF